MKSLFVLLCCGLGLVYAQTTGPRLLDLPEKDLCINRPQQWRYGGHSYYFSWDQEDYLGETQKGQKVDWLKARNECRKRCMDAVGIESEPEAKMIREFIATRDLQYIWTSGRLCDFTGCETRKDLIPLNVFGWFFSNTNTKMAPTNSTPPGWSHHPWSQTGHHQKPQPDNAEFGINQTPESCLAVLNNIYEDGITWHDIACYHKKPYICEDSEDLIAYIEDRHKIKLPRLPLKVQGGSQGVAQGVAQGVSQGVSQGQKQRKQHNRGKK